MEPSTSTAMTIPMLQAQVAAANEQMVNPEPILCQLDFLVLNL